MAAAVALVVAMLLRWPVSIYIDALPADPNTPLHALAARDLAAGGSPGRLEMLGFPDGVPVRLLAWPILLLALPLETFLPAIAAFNIAVLLWLALQGLAVYSLGRGEGWSRAGAGLAALAAMAAPSSMLALGNGQYENVAVLPIVMAIAGATRGGGRGWALCAGGLVLAMFSSPYQGIVAGVMALAAGALRGGGRRVAAVLGAGTFAAALAFPYFAAETPGHESLLTGPASAARSEPAALVRLVTPTAHPTTSPPHLPSALGRLDAAVTPPVLRLIAAWSTRTPVAASYLGIPLLFGVVGLWQGRREPLLRAAALGGLGCLLLALGSHLTVWPGHASAVPLPWAIAELLPGLGGMQVTIRFLTGVSLALAFGLGRLCGSSPIRAAAVAMALVVDALLVAPAWWPVPAAAPRISALAELLPAGPIAVWPGSPSIASDRHALLAIALHRPVALFDGAEEPETTHVGGLVASIPRLNRQGESPAAWLARVRQRGVIAFVALPVMGPSLRQPFFDQAPRQRDGLDVWRLDAEKPKQMPTPRR